MKIIEIDKLLYDAFSYCIRIEKDKKLDRDIMEQKIKQYQEWDQQPLNDYMDFLYTRNAYEIARITLELDTEVMKKDFILNKYK